MKNKFMLVCIILVSLFIIIFSDFGNQGRVYDCGMAEWHPDIPVEVKEECRRMKRQYQKEEDIKTRRTVV